MRKAVTACRRILGGVLLALAATSAMAGAPAQEGPTMGYAVAPATGQAMSPEKLKKFNETLSQAAKAYADGQFAKAVQWYQAASQLEPKREDLARALASAQAMVQKQQKAQAELPTDAAERDKALATIFDHASRLYQEGQYKMAQTAFERLWLVAGDYKGKTVKMYEKCSGRLGQSLTTVANTGLAPVAGEGVAVAVPAELPDNQPVAQAAPAAASVVDDLTQLQVGQKLKKAQDLKAEGKVAEARQLVRQALELWPDSPEAKALLSELEPPAAAPVAVAAHAAPAQPCDADARLSEGDRLFGEKKFAEAIAIFDEVLKADPANRRAEASKAKAERCKMMHDKLAQARKRDKWRHEIDVLHTQALKYYDAGNLADARKTWEEILQLDPQNKLAQTWLEETAAMAERQAADSASRAAAEKRAEAGEALLNAPITISADRKIPLSEFMKDLSFVTPSELEYYIVEGANAMISANFTDKPLREVLDTVLLPRGLAWSMNDKGVIVIEPKFISKTYNLSPSQMSKVRALLDTGDLQQIVWGQKEAPAEGVVMTLDERQNMLLVTGSALHVQRIESLLPTLQVAQEQEMVMRIYKIKESDGPKIRALISSIISASSKDSAFDLERKIYIDHDDLIVRDMPENIKKIEELLLDKKFIDKIRNESLDIQSYSLVPRDIENSSSDQIQAFNTKVIEAIEVFLYSQEGKAKAAEEGRKLFYDKAAMQLTVVDVPTNIARVSKYIDSLPQFGQKVRQEVVFPRFAVAEDLASSLERVLNLTTDMAGGGAGGGQEVVFKLRRGEDRQFRNIRVRVQRVEQNDIEDRNDDTVELAINTGAQVSQQTLQELDTQYIDDYEITAEDVLPSSGQPGEGSARIRIRFAPQSLGVDAQLLQQQQMLAESGAGQQSELEEMGITINPFGELNAIILRYTDPAVYQQALDLVQQLDQPIKQVQIETRFVEVNETRAKEFSADFNIAGLGQGRNIDWDSQLINSRFAQDVDEYRDAFGPPVENPTNANLIKGTTVLSAVIGNFPQIQYSLRLLEAEGIINITNGPRVSAIDGQEAEFRIERYAPEEINQQVQNNTLEVINPLDQVFRDIEMADVDEADNENMIDAVVLRMTPEITSEESIILNDLSAELIDMDGWLGELAVPTVQQVSQGANQRSVNTTLPNNAQGNFNTQFLLRRKKIITVARIKNGGTIVIGGWTGERTQELTSGVPVLRNMPYLGKLLFSRAQRTSDRTTLLIFLTGNLVD